jgi:hypothetical protein
MNNVNFSPDGKVSIDLQVTQISFIEAVAKSFNIPIITAKQYTLNALTDKRNNLLELVVEQFELDRNK